MHAGCNPDFQALLLVGQDDLTTEPGVGCDAKGEIQDVFFILRRRFQRCTASFADEYMASPADEGRSTGTGQVDAISLGRFQHSRASRNRDFGRWAADGDEGYDGHIIIKYILYSILTFRLSVNQIYSLVSRLPSPICTASLGKNPNVHAIEKATNIPASWYF